jgi:hypothetical protein
VNDHFHFPMTKSEYEYHLERGDRERLQERTWRLHQHRNEAYLIWKAELLMKLSQILIAAGIFLQDNAAQSASRQASQYSCGE